MNRNYNICNKHMSVRKLSVQEISEVASILNDKEAIKVLKSIRENVITQDAVDEEKRKGSKGKEDLSAFVGFAKQEDVIGEGKDEDQKALGAVSKLEGLGFIIKGVHIDNKKEETTEKYQITETGNALLAAAGEGSSSGEEKTGNEQNTVNKKLAEGKESEEEKPTPEQSKPNRARFPQGESSKTNGNEIEDFKAETNKQLGRRK
jgi:hypothetical protein